MRFKLLIIAVCASWGCFADTPAPKVSITPLHTSDKFIVEDKVFEYPNGEKWTDRLLRRQDSPTLVESVLTLESQSLLRMPYSHFVMSALYLVPNPQKILVMGLGGGSLSTTFANLFPEAKIDTVDIEKEIAEIAQNFFFFKVSSKLKIHVKDGYNFIMNLPEINTYDLIVMDAMEQGCSPESFRTEPFVRTLKAHLNPGGVIAVNTLTQCSFRSVEQGLYEKVFGDLYIVQEPESGNPHISNIILLGMKGDLPSWASIQDRAEAYRSEFQKRGIDTDALLSKMSLKINKPMQGETRSIAPGS